MLTQDEMKQLNECMGAVRAAIHWLEAGAFERARRLKQVINGMPLALRTDYEAVVASCIAKARLLLRTVPISAEDDAMMTWLYEARMLAHRVSGLPAPSRVRDLVAVMTELSRAFNATSAELKRRDR